ncbi:MAG: hypothetical protein PHU13_03150 [Acholeplasmataceae bacterium]|nr:hypothetical protein [Acholeplasmataceae bacterium]
MIKRLNMGLVAPREIGEFIHDKLRYVFLYILFLSLIVSLPIFVKTSLQNEMDSTLKNNLANTLYTENLANSIVNYQLIGEGNDGIFFQDGYFIGFKATETVLGILFNFTQNSLDLYYGPVLVSSLTYQELGLDEINFNMRSSEDKTQLFDALDLTYQDYKGSHLLGSVISSIINEFTLGLFLILIITGLSAYNIPKLKIKYRFVLSCYAFTIYYFLTLIGILFGTEILRLVGIVFAQVYMSKGYAELIQMTNINTKGESRE